METNMSKHFILKLSNWKEIKNLHNLQNYICIYYDQLLLCLLINYLIIDYQIINYSSVDPRGVSLKCCQLDSSWCFPSMFFFAAAIYFPNSSTQVSKEHMDALSGVLYVHGRSIPRSLISWMLYRTLNLLDALLGVLKLYGCSIGRSLIYWALYWAFLNFMDAL